LGDAILGFVVGVIVTTLVTLVIIAVRGYDPATASDQLTLVDQALAQVGLWFGLLGAPLYAAYRKGNGPVVDFGLRQRWFDPPFGIVVGLATQIFVGIVYVQLERLHLVDPDKVGDQARDLIDRATSSVGAKVLLVLVVVVATPVIEELFFRGLLLRSLEKRLGTAGAIVLSSLLFGLAHFQLQEFPALVVFGLVSAFLAVRTGRLGPSIWAHVAFNGITVFAVLCNCLGEDQALSHAMGFVR
jgi:CAAX protease family protein